MSIVRVAVVVEDRRFSDFLPPAVLSLARAADCQVSISVLDPTGGCRTRRLKTLLEEALPSAHVLVVGIDASAPDHRTRAVSHRQKSAHLRPLIEKIQGHERVSLAIADPCVEAWLMCDPRAFTRGLEAGLEEPFRTPPAWPAPNDERTAKQHLGALISSGLGGSLPRRGFEYANEIVSEMDLRGSTNGSLADWSREFHARLAALRIAD